MNDFSSILRGVSGQYEITRVLGAFGVLVYILAANIFEGYQIWGLHKEFDITAYCLAFPGGLGVAIAAVAGSAALKGRADATSSVIQSSGVLPPKTSA